MDTLFNGIVYVGDSYIPMSDGTTLYLDHPTALGALDEAAQLGGFSYTVVNSTYGPYVSDIEGDYWVMYWVNYTYAPVGVTNYALDGGEYLLFGTSTAYPVYPLAINGSQVASIGGTYRVDVGFVNTSWGDMIPDLNGAVLPLEAFQGATVLVDGIPVGITDQYGMLNITFSVPGNHTLVAEAPGQIRSEAL